ncbi:isoleucyl-tRNA synthetase [Salpingoeca rosetta]|uniref:isoleucine--tRNA ligase n=1 Tax=Salpingoeca rosetta (strain ATCC 50818 / BSB-021) TaxID=946362 RepID=F2U092_SALR5|nr:isoleucyl-tRNA synthetase [Salpingoeca rosetta]EGD80820.1 isoleucyl-tRNA synthetase [Salpingoeca rosetta]|eukprot:XP_004997381.1 isoleucyl-tRNA synthetase [Salpingoeca rosetta]
MHCQTTHTRNQNSANHVMLGCSAAASRLWRAVAAGSRTPLGGAATAARGGSVTHCCACCRRVASTGKESKDQKQQQQSSNKQQAKKQKKGNKQKDGSMFSDTLCLPQTAFPMRANAATREPMIQENCFKGVYEELAARDGPAFILHDGPPFANGNLHMGHVLNKALKDMIVRYKAIRGHRISFVPGWDCHGLPIEAKAVTSTSASSGTADASKPKGLTIASDPRRIRKAARKLAEGAIKEQKTDFVRLGVMADWDHPYLTLHPQYEADQVALFLRMMQAGMVQRRYRPVYWSPSSQTALAEAEIEYDEHTSTSIFVRLPLVVGDSLKRAITSSDGAANTAAAAATSTTPVNVSAVIWTTTPWTLPANQAIAVHSDLGYVLVQETKAGGDVMVVAEACLDRCRKFLPEGTTRIIGHIQGRELLDSSYRHPVWEGRTCPVFHADHVTSDAGTGVVHMAPAHGLEDYHACAANGMQIDLNLVDNTGRYTQDAGDALQGLEAMGAGGKKVLELLQEGNRLLQQEAFQHRYPLDWRTKKPIMLRATQQWFAQLQDIKHAALAALDNVQLVPEQGRTRLSSMLGLRDEWCVSRQRVWGVPIAVFCRDDTGEAHLSSEYVDHIVNVIATHGSDAWWTLPDDELFPEYMREPGVTYSKSADTMDVWFDSGTSWNAVTARAHGREATADVYLEGSDQHRGWFQSSLLTKITDDVTTGRTPTAPFKTIITHGFVLDEENRKMSKSLGNGVDPRIVINGGPNLKKEPAYGADVLRLWAASTAYQHDVNIGPSTLSITAENLRKIRNSCRFMLGNLADFSLETDAVSDLSDLDKYMLHRISQLDAGMRASYESYNFLRATQDLLNFINTDLSSFYFEISKDRLYLSSPTGASRRAAQTVVHHILDFVVHAVSPVACHLAEEVHHFRSGVDPSATKACGSLLQNSVWGDQFAGWQLPKAEAEAWEAVRDVRKRVFQHIQDARDAKVVTSSLDSEVTIRAARPLAQQLSRLQETPLYWDDSLLNAILMTSAVHVEEQASAAAAAVAGGEVASESVDVCVDVRASSRGKCPRCWRFMAVDNATPCTRCQRVLAGMPASSTPPTPATAAAAQ